jgi:hypothetical protein
VIFGPSGGSGGGSGNTGAFAGRNSGAPIFTTPGAFAGAIPVRSGGGVGCYRGRGGRGGGGGIIGGGGRGIAG